MAIWGKRDFRVPPDTPFRFRLVVGNYTCLKRSARGEIRLRLAGQPDVW